VPPVQSSVALARALTLPQELIFHEVQRLIPGYGGHYLDDNGDVVVFLRDVRDLARARPLLASTLRLSDSPNPRVIAQQAAFRFADLAFWRDMLIPLFLETPEAVALDLSEGTNQVVLALHKDASEDLVDRLRGRIALMGIPTSAVQLDSGEYVEYEGAASYTVSEPGTLRGQFDPVPAGVQIDYQDHNNELSFCTVGLATFSGAQPVLVTNSHCSRSKNSLDNTLYWQGNAVFGYEYDDAGRWECVAEGVTYMCRYADANLVAPHYGPVIEPNAIARVYMTSGDLTIDVAQPRWYVVEEAIPVQGMSVAKVGRTTGWSTGKITRTCVHLKEASLLMDKVSYCQAMGDYHRDSGDSGSPVFRVISSAASTVAMVGIHWGYYPWWVKPSGAALSPMANLYLAYPDLEILPQ
jgi:hypothetical protein